VGKSVTFAEAGITIEKNKNNSIMRFMVDTPRWDKEKQSHYSSNQAN